MKITAIIAEYNPFHKGHEYQIKRLRADHAPDYVVAVMSGNFLQRGAPAMLDKYARASMALSQGIDLVFELPVCFSTASAEGFAKGGVALASAAGCVDSLCFGAECASIERLLSLSSLLKQEPPWFVNALNEGLKAGLSFPAARARALPDFEDILTKPNNILALEYLKAITLNNAPLSPILIPRAGSGYHNTSLNAPLASASAIREAITVNTAHQRPHCLDFLGSSLPPASLRILENWYRSAAFLREDNFSLPLNHLLLMESRDSLLAYGDFTPVLANRILNCRTSFTSWSHLCEKCNTKESTYARISRILTHLLLGLKKEDCDKAFSLNTLPYLRILGFRKDAAPLLTLLKEKARAPVITAPAKAEEALDGFALTMLRQDIYAADLYRAVLTNVCGQVFPNEYQRRMLIIK